jgi:hypothetical protein
MKPLSKAIIPYRQKTRANRSPTVRQASQGCLKELPDLNEPSVTVGLLLEALDTIQCSSYDEKVSQSKEFSRIGGFVLFPIKPE